MSGTSEPAPDHQRSIPAGGDIKIPNGKATPPKPRWYRDLEAAMDTCRKDGIPYILVAVAPDGKIVGGYKGDIPVLEETMLALARQLNQEMQLKRRMAPLVDAEGNPVSSGQKEKP